MKMESVHFLSVPEWSDALIDEKTETMIQNMQDAIETGRFVRDEVKVSMKYPLQKVKLINSDANVLAGYKVVERYMMDELHCKEIEYE